MARVDSGGSREVDLNGVSTSQTDASVTVTTSRAPVGGHHVAAIVARSRSATLMYRGRVRIAPDGTVLDDMDVVAPKEGAAPYRAAAAG
ncbi:MAG: hypothetical protein K0R11_1834, partial [Acidimicrobiales bacterium]|nr:hypothetical protein [Acidimicrobiales bacterium]